MSLIDKRKSELEQLSRNLKAFEPVSDDITTERSENLYNAIKEVQLSVMVAGITKVRHLAKAIYWISREMRLHDGQ